MSDLNINQNHLKIILTFHSSFKKHLLNTSHVPDPWCWVVKTIKISTHVELPFYWLAKAIHKLCIILEDNNCCRETLGRKGGRKCRGCQYNYGGQRKSPWEPEREPRGILGESHSRRGEQQVKRPPSFWLTRKPCCGSSISPSVGILYFLPTLSLLLWDTRGWDNESRLLIFSA